MSYTGFEPQWDAQNQKSMPAYRMSMSIGPLRDDFDRQGSPCLVVDVVFNPEEFEGGQDKHYGRRVGMIEVEKLQTMLSGIAHKTGGGRGARSGGGPLADAQAPI